MRHHEQRRSKLHVQALQKQQNLATGLRVEVARRFVGDHDERIRNNGASNTHTLFLATGELTRVMVGPIRQTNGFQRNLDTFLAPGDESGKRSRGISMFSYAVNTGIRL